MLHATPEAAETRRLTGTASGVDTTAVFEAFRSFASRFEMGWETEGDTITLRFGEDSRLELRGEGDVLHLAVEAPEERGRYRIQQIALTMLERGGFPVAPVWSHQWRDHRPPSLALAEVVSVTEISPGFRRVRLKGNDLARFGADALHFRFLLPPIGRLPVWPHVDEGGRTRWPEGEDAIHRPVYTFRMIDGEAGLADVDVFVHEGGRVTDWTSKATPGTPVGLMGPTGRGVPEVEWVALFADETAVPALARHLATLPATARGYAFVLAGAADRQELAAPEGVTVKWLAREFGGDLVAALEALEIPEGGRHIWFSSEKSECEAARKLLHETRDIPKSETHVTAYWARGVAES